MRVGDDDGREVLGKVTHLASRCSVPDCLRVKIMHDTSLVLLLHASHSLIGDKMPRKVGFASCF